MLQRLVEWIQNKTHIYAVCIRLTSEPETNTNWKWEDGKIFHANRNQKKTGVAILISDKIDLKEYYKR